MWFFCSLHIASASSPPELRTALLMHVHDAATIEVLQREASEAGARVERSLRPIGETQGLSLQLQRQIAASLVDKATRTTPVLLDPDRIRRTVIGYEEFKLESYVTSGVFPKRYFGYLDGQGDTSSREIRVMRTARDAVAAANQWAAGADKTVRITEAEVIVTFLAEGGALWLGQEPPFHPVMDVGLDDLALGHRDQPELLSALDAGTGSRLIDMVAWWDGLGPLPVASSLSDGERWLRRDHGKGDPSKEGPFPYLTRGMTLEETVVGTVLMYVWEKEIAERLLRESGQSSIMTRPLDEQFVIASLVYNSGLLHDSARWKQIKSFSTGTWLYDRSQRNRATRPELNLQAPAQQLEEFLRTGQYREQYTSWVAVYHVLQRYGGFAGLYRFTDTFTPEGRFASIPATEVPPPSPVSKAATDSDTDNTRTGWCSLLPDHSPVSGVAAWGLALVVALISRRAR